MHLILMADAVNAALASAGSQLLAAFAAFSQAAAPAAVAALWQGATVAVALVLSLRLAPRVSAAHRFTVWAAGFAVVASLPFLPLMVHVTTPAVVLGSPAVGAGANSWLEWDSRWGLTIAALWLTASAFRGAQFLLHTLRLRMLWKTATPIQNGALAASLAAAVKTRHPIEVCTTRHLDRPSVIGFFVPRVLIPEWLLGRLSAQELEQVVLHEAEHLRRRDDWSNLLQKLSLVLFPLNPALAWMERRLCREREMACDEGVVRRTQAPRAYAACLASLAERGLTRRAEALSLGAFERRPELVRRVHCVLRRQRALHPLAARALMSVVGCGLLLASVEMARCPQTVAFVTSSKPHAQARSSAPAQSESEGNIRTSDVLPRPSSEVARNASGFHAVEAKAVLTTNRGAEAPALSARHSPEHLAGAAQQEVALRDSNARGPRPVLLKAEIPGSGETPAAETQYVVVAAWERVETSSHRVRAFADYDAGTQDPGRVGAANNDKSDDAPSRVTVVRMVLAVYPIPAAPAVTSGAQRASAPKASRSNSELSAAPVPESGWLVLQL